jgi:hypothetical protein
MEKELKGQLRSLHHTYSAVYSQFSRIEKEASRLEDERKVVSQILDNTRELEKDVINKLEETLGKKLTHDDILEIIKEYE